MNTNVKFSKLYNVQCIALNNINATAHICVIANLNHTL